MTVCIIKRISMQLVPHAQMLVLAEAPAVLPIAVLHLNLLLACTVQRVLQFLMSFALLL